MDLRISLIIFIAVYLLYFFFIIKRKDALEKYKTSVEVTYLKNVYKLNLEDYNFYKLANVLVLINSFMFALVVYLITINYFLIFIIIPLQLVIYHFIGKYLKRKEVQNV